MILTKLLSTRRSLNGLVMVYALLGGCEMWECCARIPHCVDRREARYEKFMNEHWIGDEVIPLYLIYRRRPFVRCALFARCLMAKYIILSNHVEEQGSFGFFSISFVRLRSLALHLAASLPIFLFRLIIIFPFSLFHIFIFYFSSVARTSSKTDDIWNVYHAVVFVWRHQHQTMWFASAYANHKQQRHQALRVLLLLLFSYKNNCIRRIGDMIETHYKWIFMLCLRGACWWCVIHEVWLSVFHIE